jgi:hypothetical protein
MKYLVDTYNKIKICPFTTEEEVKARLIEYMGEQCWEQSGHEEFMSLKEIMDMGGLEFQEYLEPLTDQQWVDLTRQTINMFNGGNLRLGQSYMNALHKIRADLYKSITATDNDCFYEDNKIVNFITYLISLKHV